MLATNLQPLDSFNGGLLSLLLNGEINHTQYNYFKNLPTEDFKFLSLQYDKVLYAKEQTFVDGYKKITLSKGYKPTTALDKLLHNKKLSLGLTAKQRRFDAEKQAALEPLLKTNLFNYADKNAKFELENSLTLPDVRSIENLKRAARRSKQKLYDMMCNNEFNFFATLTFNKEKVDRLDVNATKEAFGMWRKAMKRKFPNMIYIAVPEYHKKGGLHYHLMIGNVTADNLRLVDSGKKVNCGYTRGATIFNISSWDLGFSTATLVQDTDKCVSYITKYLRKQQLDIRFASQKRYYASHNVLIPAETVQSLPYDEEYRKLAENCEKLDIVYRDQSQGYTVFKTVANVTFSDSSTWGRIYSNEVILSDNLTAQIDLQSIF